MVGGYFKLELKKLLNNIDYKLLKGSLNKNIKEIRYDSRKIKEDNLFIAITGFEVDGHNFINDAVKNGAKTIVLESKISNYIEGVTYLKVENSRKTMAKLAKNFFDDPLKDINLVGITGTNGKTTTAYLLYNIFKKAEGKAALFGTIKNVISDQEISSSRTTAESVDLFRYFAAARAKGLKYAVMEVSSHALDLYRVAEMDFKAAIFTNISSEHLDYHKTIKNYRKVKSRLFSNLSDHSFAVINFDDPNSEFISQKSNTENYFYSLNSKEADLYTKKYSLNKKGMNYQTEGKIKTEFDLKLGGIFNIYNSLAAVLTADLLGINIATIKESLKETTGVPGRFEIIDAGQDFQIIVDYAHTPDAMKNVLETAVELKKRKLIVLFGCGGDRDRSKRALMAEMAEKFADYTIISNDNPRNEDPQKIFSEIELGFSSDFKDYEIIEDRAKAIKKVVNLAEKDDLLMILGRGHEKYQVLKSGKIELDDREVAYQAAKKLSTNKKL